MSTLQDPSDDTQVVETHISRLFFVQDKVFKLRKPVNFGFLDFSSRAAREADCYREVELNRRFAPDIYLGVYDVVDRGSPVDHLVVMRRLPPERRLSKLVEAGVNVHEDLAATIRVLIDADSRAARSSAIDEAGRAAALRDGWEANHNELVPFLGTILDTTVDARIMSLAREYLLGRSSLLDERIAHRRVRDGHGDLRADDIYCLVDGPRILDCVEFDDTLRYGDILSDLAFLVMDLEFLGSPQLDDDLLRTYTELSGDVFPKSLVWAYAAARSYIRAKIACLEVGDRKDAEERARRHHELALSLLERAEVSLILIGGSPGSGKSTLAAGLGGELEIEVLRSDVIRKELVEADGCSEDYSPAMTVATYKELRRRARSMLDRGESVILDASWHASGERLLAREIAEAVHCKFVEIRCDAPLAVLEARIVARSEEGTDASGATVEVARAMIAESDEWPTSVTVDTSRTPSEALRSATLVVQRAVAR